MLVNLADACQIVEAEAVVGRRPHSRQLTIEHLIVAFLSQLVRPVNSYTPIFVKEALNHVCAEHVAGAATGELEALGVGVRVRPHEIREWALVRDLFDAFDLPYVINVLKRG